MADLLGRLRVLPAVLSASLAIGACAGGEFPLPTWQPLTPAEKEMRKSALAFDRTVTEGALFGTALGAAVGAVGGDAGTGAALGATVGTLAGAYIAQRQGEYADREALLDALISDVRQKNEEAEVLVRAMEVLLRESLAQYAEVQRQLGAGEISRRDFDAEVARIGQDRAIMSDAVQSADIQRKTFQAAYDGYSSTNPDVDTGAYKAEIDALGGRIEAMSKIVDQLADVAPENA